LWTLVLEKAEHSLGKVVHLPAELWRVGTKKLSEGFRAVWTEEIDRVSAGNAGHFFIRDILQSHWQDRQLIAHARSRERISQSLNLPSTVLRAFIALRVHDQKQRGTLDVTPDLLRWSASIGVGLAPDPHFADSSR
jgi:hypothetical protein